MSVKESGKKRIAAVEAGGTTFKLAVAVDTPDNIVASTRVDTTEPEETLAAVVAWLSDQEFDELAVSSFGPIDLREGSETYGYITTTPKPGWAQTDLLGALKEHFEVVAFDTDVNAAAVGEMRVGGHGEDVTSCAYVTVGTGIGVGVVIQGQPVHGLLHPEGGHMFVRRAQGDTHKGSCPFHGDCLEGMAASGALAERCDCDRSELPNVDDDDEVWTYEAQYLGDLCLNLTLTLSPEVIVLAGGVMQRDSLFPKIREHFRKQLNGYVSVEKISEQLDTYIVPSRFGDNAGLVGTLAMAMGAGKSG